MQVGVEEKERATSGGRAGVSFYNLVEAKFGMVDDADTMGKRDAVRHELFVEVPESRASSRVWPLAVDVHSYFLERRLWPTSGLPTIRHAVVYSHNSYSPFS